MDASIIDTNFINFSHTQHPQLNSFTAEEVVMLLDYIQPANRTDNRFLPAIPILQDYLAQYHI
jgi:hypothetical protein